MDVVRITELQPKTYVEQGDYIAIDNQSNGTKKVQFTNLLDDTLSQENKIAPANVVGDEIATIRASVGSPLKASTVAQMTNTNKIYVYVGSESGYTNGNWYYWNGSAWTSGGVYNSVAVVTDPNLTLSGVPADAKATGDEITDLKADMTQITGNGAYSYTREKSIGRSSPITQANESGWESVIVPCVAGDVFNVKGWGGNSTRLWMFSNSSGTLLSESVAALHTSDYVEVVAPTNAAYLSCNSQYSQIKGSVIKNVFLQKEVSSLKSELSTLFYDLPIIEQGYFAISNGTKTDSSTWCRFKEFIPKNYVIRSNTIGMLVQAFTRSGSYVGTWNGTAFVTVWQNEGLLNLVDINEFMEANPTYQFKITLYKYGTAFTPADAYNDLSFGNALEESVAEINKTLGNAPIAVKTFTVSAGKSHSSLSDKLFVSINSGEKYVVLWNGHSLYIEYSDGTNSGAIHAKPYKATASKDIVSMGVYLDEVETDTEVKLLVFTNPIGYDLYDSIETGAKSSAFQIGANQTHSSLNDQLDVDIEQDEYFYVVANGIERRTNNTLYAVSNGNAEQLGSLSNGFIRRFKANAPIQSLGLFVASGTESATVQFSAFTQKSILTELTAESEYDNQYRIKLMNAKRKANPANYNNLTSPEIFTIAHFSDIHGSAWAMKEIQTFKDRYGIFLDDVLCTGDIVVDELSDGTAFWDDNSDGEVLICIGNHDSLDSDGWDDPAPQQTLYETYIEPYENKWNANTVSGHTYWYKDYADKKIRLIAVDATIYDSAEQASQMSWLENVLAGAITNNYAVVGAIHFPPMPANMHKVDSNFTALLHGTATDMSQFAWHVYHTEILSAVEQFITSGGNFVCWLTGHTHWDLISYDDRFPRQLFVTISCAMPSAMLEERIRDVNNGTGLVLNTVCVDTVRKYVKLLRYGAEWDDCLRHTGSCVIKYDANPPTVVFQN